MPAGGARAAPRPIHERPPAALAAPRSPAAPGPAMHCPPQPRLAKAGRRRYKTFMIDEILSKETCDYFEKLSLYSVCPSLLVRPKPLHSCAGKEGWEGLGRGSLPLSGTKRCPPGPSPSGERLPVRGMRRDPPDLAVRRLILVHHNEQDGVSTAGVSQMDLSDTSF